MKKFWQFIKTPKVWLSILVCIATLLFIALTLTLTFMGIQNFWVYPIYVIAFLLLCYGIYIIVYFAPKIKQRFLKLALKNKYTKKYIQNFGFRSLVSSFIGFVINAAYACMLAVFAILSHSVWYGALATYYIMLSLIKGGIIAKHNKRKSIENQEQFFIDQVKSYKNCGWFLTALTFTLVAAIVQMVIANQGFEYAGIMIYVMATYTFYKLTMAIINMIKARRNKDLTVQSLKNLNLASALVALLSLQTAMFQAFGQDVNPRLFNALTGGGVTLCIITIAVLMIAKGRYILKKVNKQN
ncbi:MAG: hypothetical protein E7376_03455 [Clostridiales bacterium]|nr:hypothetical protein [Clostridiales bacterium]